MLIERDMSGYSWSSVGVEGPAASCPLTGETRREPLAALQLQLQSASEAPASPRASPVPGLLRRGR